MNTRSIIPTFCVNILPEKPFADNFIVIKVHHLCCSGASSFGFLRTSSSGERVREDTFARSSSFRRRFASKFRSAALYSWSQASRV